MSNNKHIEDYLDYYLNLQKPPEYAVLLKGAWGTGKTWFIKNYLSKLEQSEKKHLYVSLYGLSSFTAIQEEMFRVLHPVLGSKGMELAGKFLKGAINATLKIDLNADGKNDGTASFRIPDIKLPDYLNTEGFLLIFDDLERCSIKISDLLGFINHFVEHQGYKVIIIANEDEILKKDEKQGTASDSDLSYKRIREKLIGKSFEIAPHFDDAFESFVSSVSSESAKAEFIKSKSLVKEIYQFSGYKNLRFLRQALLELERLFGAISQHIFKNGDLISHLLQVFLVYSFESKNDDLHKIWDFDIVPAKDSPLRKYKTVDFYSHLLSNPIWLNIFERGIIESAAINESLLKSNYFRSEQMPTWVKLWNWHDLYDEEFARLIAELENELALEQHSDIGVITHITGMFLWFSDVGFYRKTKSDILAETKDYLEKLKKKDLLPEWQYEPFELGYDSWGGLCFYGVAIKEFKDFKAFLKNIIKNAYAEKLPKAGEELLAIMQTDTDKFCRMIFSSNEDGIYRSTPILCHIPASNFVDTLLKVTPNKQRFLVSAIGERYKNNYYNEILKDELSWLKEVEKLLIVKRDKANGKPSGYTLGLLITNSIRPSIDTLSRLFESTQGEPDDHT